MSKGNYHSKKSESKVYIWLIAVLAVAVIAVAFGLFASSDISNGKSQTDESKNPTASTIAAGDATQPADMPVETTLPVIIENITQPPVEIVEQADADYERWLAAAMIIGLSVEYPDFEITDIYLASETTLDKKEDSLGCYIFFTSGGEKHAIHAAPLAQERTEPGTVDLSAQNIGFAAFDLVDPASVDPTSYISVTMMDLQELISQSMLVSLSRH